MTDGESKEKAIKEGLVPRVAKFAKHDTADFQVFFFFGEKNFLSDKPLHNQGKFRVVVLFDKNEKDTQT